MSTSHTISTYSPSYTQDFSEERSVGWWLEVFVAEPPSIYYFGPFENTEIAELEQLFIIKDFVSEGAEGLSSKIYFYNPNPLHRLHYFPSSIDIL